MWIKGLNVGIKTCRVTSDKKNVGNNPNEGGKHYTYEHNNNNNPPGQDKSEY